MFGRRKNKADAVQPKEQAEQHGHSAEAETAEVGQSDNTVVERAATGPLDASETTGDNETRLDLGAIQLAGINGMQIRLEVDEEQHTVSSVTVILGRSAAQFTAYAAPKTTGLWDEIRLEIADGIEKQGGSCEPARGPFGKELHTQLPSDDGHGRVVMAPVRFMGVDGPRWFFRAVLNGEAAADERAAAPFLDIIRRTVIVRGSEPMAPREMLPLKMPSDAPAPSEPVDEPTQRARDLNPFERGPEITEVH